jgi:hypothetical protein
MIIMKDPILGKVLNGKIVILIGDCATSELKKGF